MNVLVSDETMVMSLLGETDHVIAEQPAVLGAHSCGCREWDFCHAAQAMLRMPGLLSERFSYERFLSVC